MSKTQTEPAPSEQDVAHEAADRIHVLNCTFAEHVAIHPAIAADPALRAMAEEIEERLGILYQAIAAKM